MKISILLPYKENFSPNYAGAVSLFVKDMTRQSKYRNNISVFVRNFHENRGLAHGPILELEAHGPIREYSFFLKNGPKSRLGPWAYMRGNTVIIGFP